MTLETEQLFNIQIDRTTLGEATQQVLQWCAAPRPDAGCRYVVTPNLDHAVMFRDRADLRAAYAAASMVLADGFPLVLASKLVGSPLPERVAGSDLVPTVLGAGQPLKVFLLGAGPGVGERAAANIRESWPAIDIVGVYSPPYGFEYRAADNQEIHRRIDEATPDLLVVGLGAPKQELWVHTQAERLSAKVALCVGATIDFLAGEKQRSPEWMQDANLEWLHRLATEPRRLAKRYGHDAVMFPRMLAKEWFRRR